MLVSKNKTQTVAEHLIEYLEKRQVKHILVFAATQT